ncbi:right-handed parallel beta-helix repeat-containing protein [Methanosarcina sp. Z-7115]|uniref:Right-handed parallel beta-helix repeat-containing protein n=1 Tax=Methanosarcina baikalica TaxID=3073890 RepID=A0ABU2D016_9EURY|nr:right-handed parallel beta-helix repeat-containing protein [Methanosarcina sp. Z-7115]MDR7665323.1 right-handed parallel beta-helix repeat-containing protein [Methanosarcina sp. Z-7115]
MNEKYLRYVRQNWKKIGFSIVNLIFLIGLGIFIFHTIQSISPLIPSNETVWVTGDGSEKFTCDGSDDQVEINQALAHVAENPQFTTVYLKGPNTYVISDSIFIGNNTTLEGDPTAVIRLIDNADWPVFKPLITQINSTEIHGVTIKGFEIDGNHDNNLDKKKGLGYYNMIHFLNSTDIQVHNMYMHDGHGEGVKVDSSYNIRFYNNTAYKTGHNGLFAEDCQNVEAWNNKITVRTDSGFRSRNSNYVKLHDNEIDSFYHWSAGGAGILIEKTTGVVNDVEIYNNTIQNTYGPGIWLIGCCKSYPKDEAKNVHIYHNIFRKTGTNPHIDWVGGIVTSGFYDTLIENNTFDGVYHGAIVHMYPTGGTHIYPTYNNSGHIDLSPKDTGYTTIVRNNIIANTKQRNKDPNGTGYGVINYLPETHTFVLENNCLYNNYAGNYLNCASTTDIYVDPLLLNQKIGAGYSSEELPKNINQTTIKSIFLKRCS